MRGLYARLSVLFLAVASVGATTAYVGFVVWGQQVVQETRRSELAAAVVAVQGQLDRPRSELHRTLQAIDATLDVQMTLIGEGIPWLQSTPATLPTRLPNPKETALIQGKLYLVAAAEPRYRPWTRIVAYRPVSDVYDRVFATQLPVAVFLMVAVVAMIAVGLALARRSLVTPLGRLSALVAAADRAGLRTFGSASDSFSALGRGIASMDEQIHSDRERIARQLEQLRLAHDQLERTQNQLVRAERLAVVGTLAAGLAHELGNPLAVVRGFVELLRGSALPEAERSAALERMERELERIQAIVRDLLDFSRASADTAGSSNLAAVFDEFAALLKPQRAFADVSIEVRSPPADAVVAIQAGALIQVLLNLALNAADAMSGMDDAAGSGADDAAARDMDDAARRGGKANTEPLAMTMSIGSRVQDESIAIRIEDSGPGIPDDHLSRVFEPFFTTKPRGKGTGLGLSVCERIVTSAGGEITADRSAKLGGARFTIVLPRLRVAPTGDAGDESEEGTAAHAGDACDAGDTNEARGRGGAVFEP